MNAFSPKPPILENSAPNGAPSQGTPLLMRASNFARAVMNKKTFAFAIVGMTLQVVLPSPLKPSDMIGGFLGRLVQVEQDITRPAVTMTAAQIAEANARAQAIWAMEVETARQQQQASLESLQMLIFAANTADAICLSGPLATIFLGRDAADYARAAGGACGEAARIRRQIVEAQVEAARYSAIMQRPAPVPMPIPVSAK